MAFPIDSHVHHRVLYGIVAHGYAPTAEELADALGTSNEEVAQSLRRLHESHGLVLHPGSTDIWIAHPFSLSPTAVWVLAKRRGWWAPCMWCAMGVAVLVGGDAQVRTRLGAEEETP